MDTQNATTQIAVDAVTLQQLLPTRRRFAAFAVTVTWLMAAVFLMLGMEARSIELRIASGTAVSAGVASAALHAPATQRRR